MPVNIDGVAPLKTDPPCGNSAPLQNPHIFRPKSLYKYMVYALTNDLEMGEESICSKTLKVVCFLIR